MDLWLKEMLAWIDPVLIAPYRLTPHGLFNFFVGSFILAMEAAVAGEITLSLAIRCNRDHIDALKHEITRSEALSLKAYASGDKAGYKALNQAANDAWGRHFFNMAAYSAGMLWPVPFALAWMHQRFAGIDLVLAWPLNLLMGSSVGYPFVFIPLYILARILFGRMRRWLPYFRRVQRELDAAGTPPV